MKEMSDGSKRESSQEIRNLVLTLLRSIEDLKSVVAPLLEDQKDAKEILKTHTDTLEDLMGALVTVKKDKDLIKTDLDGIKTCLFDYDRVHRQLRTRINRIEMRHLKKLYDKAIIVIEIGDPELQKLELSAKEEQKDPDLWFVVGIVYHNKDHYVKALKCFNRVTRINVEDGHAWCWKALSQKGLGKHSEAVESLEKAAQRVECPHIFRLQASSMMLLGQKEDALKLATQAIQGDKENAEYWALKGSIMRELDKHMEALSCIEKSLQLNPELVTALNEKGIILFELGPNYYEEGYNSFHKATELDPNFYGFWCNRGKALAYLERHEEAIKSFDRALELEPNDACVYCLKGISESMLGKQIDALKSFDEALKRGLKKRCETFYCNRAIVLINLERYKDALEAIEKGITINLGDPDLWILKAEALLELGKKDEIEKCIKTAMQYSITKARSLNSLAWTLYKMKRYSIALKFANEAVKKEPNSAYYLDTLACINYELGEYQEALRLFEKAVDLRKDDKAISWSILIELYEKLGKADKAKKIKERYTK